MEKNLEMALLLDHYGELLTPRQREWMDGYYNQDLSLGEIAAQAEVSRQAVQDGIKRAESQLLTLEARLGCAACRRDNALAQERLYDLADQLCRQPDPALGRYGEKLRAIADAIRL